MRTCLVSLFFLLISVGAHASYQVCAGPNLYSVTTTNDTVFQDGEVNGSQAIVFQKKLVKEFVTKRGESASQPYLLEIRKEKLLSEEKEHAKTTKVFLAEGTLKKKAGKEFNDVFSEQVVCTNVQIFAPGP